MSRAAIQPTGLPPDSAPGAVRPNSAVLLQDFLGVRQSSMHICAPLGVEDHSLQSMPDASPAKWHLAHTTWFFETFVLSQYAERFRSYHPAFRNLFNSYYNAVGDRPLRSLRHILSRPSLEEVYAYRSFVDEAMARLLETDLPPAALELIALGLNHEQQHQELIVTDVKHGLWSNPLRPAYQTQIEGDTADPIGQALRWQSFPEGLYSVGFAGEGFAFDNEKPRHSVYLQAFRLASRLITNAEYLEFLGAGGYSTANLWLSDGWDAVRNNQWAAPLYWEQRDGDWWMYTLAGMQPLRLNEPVCHLSFYEADAYARWAGARLATEFEWEIAATTRPIKGNFLDSGALHPQPASADPFSTRDGMNGEPGVAPLSQMFGDVWEWTASAYTPYPGFRTAPGAVGEYNGKFMCNQMVLRGGSCATPLSHIRATYRNFFPPHVRWQFMGVRLANGD
ncbi:MAG TPA: ergothioneine biosynthesis protein EgtB [Terriglobales bacterium]|nr:ergothioneine biosynthesis protein EgtB [Terriglobales bacterium]